MLTFSHGKFDKAGDDEHLNGAIAKRRNFTREHRGCVNGDHYLDLNMSRIMLLTF